MKVGIVGFGYIGSVCAAGLVDDVSQIIIVDPDKDKTEKLKSKVFQFPERDVEKVINRSSILVANDIRDILDANLILICVNTPLKKDGNLDDSILREVITNLYEYRYSGIVVIRSTLPFSSIMFDFIDNCKLNVFVVPEFLREGSALNDFKNGEVLVIGKQKTADLASTKMVRKLFAKYFKTTVEMEFRSAVYLKLLNNTWHATKVAFANEWWRLAEKLGIPDIDQIYKGFVGDEKLNTSVKYMRPGGPYGGPCLTKDIVEFNNLDAGSIQEITQAVVKSNVSYIEELSCRLIEACIDEHDSFSFDTLEFKLGTDDARHSPLLDVITYVRKHSKLKYEQDPLLADCVFSGRGLLDEGRLEILKI